MPRNKIYIELYNAKNHPDDEDFNETVNPIVVGPFDAYVITYGEMYRMMYKGRAYRMFMDGGMILFKGFYFADWALIPTLPKTYNYFVHFTVPIAMKDGWLEEF